jgi:hypothetical protein
MLKNRGFFSNEIEDVPPSAIHHNVAYAKHASVSLAVYVPAAKTKRSQNSKAFSISVMVLCIYHFLLAAFCMQQTPFKESSLRSSQTPKAEAAKTA